MRRACPVPPGPSSIEGVRPVRAGLHARIEALPPFWTAFALTLTETVGAGALALPIAFATVGPLVGAALLVALGALNAITVAFLAEASARNGSIRHGDAFVGRLVRDFLGRPASVVVRLCMFAACCTLTASFYTGFASTLSAATGVPAPVWVTVVCGASLALILRRSLGGTLASALLVGAINIAILVALSVIALGHATAENLLQTGLASASGTPFEAAHLQLVFGVVGVAYFGHLSVSNCARTVLRRDPGGRSLKRGTAAAMAVAIVLYCLWSISVGAAVGGERLHGETGTALVALAERAGPGVHVLGVVFAVLGLGMSSVHFGLGIFNLARELAAGLPRAARTRRLGVDPATVAAVLPILAVFGYVQWTYLVGTPSFTAPLALLGALVTPLLAGVFPVLLLVASRARGLPIDGAEVPRAASGPVMRSLVVLLSFAGILAHGLVIWDDPVARTAAFAVAAVMACVIGDLVRRRAFSPRLCIDIRQPADGGGPEVVVAFDGEAIRPIVRSRQPGRPGRAPADLEIELPRGTGSHVHIHAFRALPGVGTEPLGGTIAFRRDAFDVASVELDACGGTTRARLPQASGKPASRASRTACARAAAGEGHATVDILLAPGRVRDRRRDASVPPEVAARGRHPVELDIELGEGPHPSGASVGLPGSGPGPLSIAS